MIIKKTYEAPKGQFVRDDGDTVHERALAYVRHHPDSDYRGAVLAVLRKDAELAKRYYGRAEKHEEDTSGCIPARTYTQCHNDLHEQVLEYMAAHPGFTYPEARKVIWSLPKNRLLVAKYTRNSARRIVGDEGD